MDVEQLANGRGDDPDCTFRKAYETGLARGRALVEQAVAAERERCAQIADEIEETSSIGSRRGTAHEIAVAIRNP